MNRRKKVLILSRWYYPIKNPRAFRTTELLQELYRRGKYDVTAVLPNFADLQNCGADVHFIPTISVPAKCAKNAHAVSLSAVGGTPWRHSWPAWPHRSYGSWCGRFLRRAYQRRFRVFFG